MLPRTNSFGFCCHKLSFMLKSVAVAVSKEELQENKSRISFFLKSSSRAVC